MTTTTKKILCSAGLLSLIIGISAPAMAQYYGVDDSVEVDLGVLNAAPAPRNLFPTVQLTPPPVAEVDTIDAVPAAVPLFSTNGFSTSGFSAQYSAGNAFGDEAATRTASGSSSAAATHGTVSAPKEIDMPDFVKNPPVGYAGRSPDPETVAHERILKPSAAAIVTEPIVTEPVEIIAEPVSPPPAVIKAPAASPKAAPFKPVSPDKRLGTIDRAMAALTEKPVGNDTPVAEIKPAHLQGSISSPTKVNHASTLTPVIAAQQPAAAAPAIAAAITPPPSEAAPAVLGSDASSIVFDGNNAALSPEHKEQLSLLVGTLKTPNDKRQVTINGYAAGDGTQAAAQKTALARTIVVRAFLLENGIDPLRITLNAVGKPGSGQNERVDITVK